METTLTTGTGYGYENYSPFSDVLTKIGETECSVNTNVKDAQYTIVDKMTADNLLSFKDRSDIAQRQASDLNSVERDIQNRVHENRMILTKEIHDQADKVNANVSLGILEVKNQTRDFQIDTANKFGISQLEASKNTASVLLDSTKTSAASQLEAAKNFSALMLEGNKNTEAILAKLNVDTIADLTGQIAELRYECERGKWMNGLANQNAEISSIKQLIGSIDQTQKYGSKTVQFGEGNTSGTEQQGNQAWSKCPYLDCCKSGSSGTSGTSGTSGSSGSTSSSGTSGTSGNDGTSGTNGNGIDGTSGTSGNNGTNGTSGIDGTNGTSGSSGTNGTSGSSGTNGTSGSSGTNGTSGSSGTSGKDKDDDKSVSVSKPSVANKLKSILTVMGI